ncbi:alpha/beta fold hydrolase [Kribbella sp. NPDC056951]|uniref:alpha/beta fold hydrolase n=1 Tax=Kribbella sp. NPDC056951 TaxID=3345978 RepID=UPI003632E7B4
MAVDGVRVPDGRWVELWDGGALGGTPVIFLAGCPDTRHAAYPGAEAARRLDVRLVGINRPGYGRSTSHASTHLSVADDVVAVADALGIERFAVVGMSIGGPYAVACAVRHPDRVTALGVLASPAACLSWIRRTTATTSTRTPSRSSSSSRDPRPTRRSS